MILIPVTEAEVCIASTRLTYLFSILKRRYSRSTVSTRLCNDGSRIASILVWYFKGHRYLRYVLTSERYNETCLYVEHSIL